MGNDAKINVIINGQDRASAVLHKFGNNLQRLAKVGLVAATAAVSALGAALTKFVIGGGISRALNIEDAQAKLRGLGHDVRSIEGIMDSALKAVKGTAFGLDAAATAAASAVASGVKPGEELTKRLSLVGDAATIAGVSFNEMSSIFGKVQTQQRAYTMELNQLADRGIPIYQWLQKELGLTQEQLREMVAAGEVDAETYFKVIQDNIGGAALESGKTTRGAWENMKAAMARVGAEIVKDIIPRVRTAFGDITKWFDDNSQNIVKAVGSIADKLGEVGNFIVQNVVPIFKAVRDQLIEWWPTIKDVGIQIGEYLMPKLERLWTAIREELIPALQNLWKSYIEPLIPVIGTLLVVAIGFFVDALSLIVENIDILIPVLAAFGGMLLSWQVLGAIDKVKIAIIAQGGLKAALVNLGGWLKGATMANGMLVSPWGLMAAAALLAFAKIQQAAQDTKRILDDTVSNVEAATDSITDATRRISNNPNLSQAEKSRLIRGIMASGNQLGGTVRGGRAHIVGEAGPELFIPPSGGGSIVPNNRLSGGSNVNLNVNIGVYAGTPTERRNVARQLFESLSDVARQQGSSVGEMLNG